jgi:hypothetical protein
MNTSEAIKITHTLSKPSKMPGFSIGIPAKECKTGAKLRKVKGSVCFGCYALKGCYVFPDVQAAQYKRLRAIKKKKWIDAMAHQINSKKVKYFRWHDSGDVQNLEHLNKIYEVCKLSPTVKHWMPTREAWIADHVTRAPDNLIIRFSMPMIDQAAAGSWPNTSTVETKSFFWKAQLWFNKIFKITGKCFTPIQGNKCLDCRACWNHNIKNVAYGKH